MKSNLVLLVLSCMVVFGSAKAQHVDQQKERENLMNVSREWAKSVTTGDVEQIVSFWSDDAVLMTPDQGKLVGREQLTAMVAGSTKIPGFEIGWEPVDAHVARSGELGYVIAHKYVKVPDEAGNLNTFYFVEVGIWEKQEDGSWKNTIDIYNPDPSIVAVNN